MWIIPGGQHNNTFMMAGPMYYIRVRQFLDKCKSLSLRKGLGHQEPQEKPKEKKSPAMSKVAAEEDITEGLGSGEGASKSGKVIDDLVDAEVMKDKKKQGGDAIDKLLDD